MNFINSRRIFGLGSGAAILCPLMVLNLNLAAFTVSGHVRDFVTGENLSQVDVILISNEHTFRDTVTTNYQGDWEYTGQYMGLREQQALPCEFTVRQNFPNPFNPTTSIEFGIATPGLVEIAVFNLLGQQIDVKKQRLDRGNYQVMWKSSGPAGVYFYTIRTKGKSITRKMIQLDGGQSGGFSEIAYTSRHSVLPLAKPTSVSLTLIFNKFAYVGDTLKADVNDGEHFEIALETIHNSLTLIDLHNDILEQMLNDPTYHWMPEHSYHHTDIPRLIRGGVDVQFFVIWINPNTYTDDYYQGAQAALNLFHRELDLYPNYIQQARTFNEAIDINNGDKIAAVMCVEGGHTIENSVDNLISLYNEGMRYLTITWNNSTDWAVSAKDEYYGWRSGGLSDFGREVIHTLDSLGVIIDVSHTGIETINDILETTVNPIIASHSGARAVTDHYRNLYDSQIEAIADVGGVVGVVFYPYYVSGSRSASIGQVIAHIDHIVNLVGVDYVAIGSDFDGIEVTVTGLEDVSKFPDLTYALLEHGYTKEDVAKILGQNFRRVFEQVCGKQPARMVCR